MIRNTQQTAPLTSWTITGQFLIKPYNKIERDFLASSREEAITQAYISLGDDACLVHIVGARKA